MYLEKFMNEHTDWRTALSEKPYCLEIKEDGEYYVLKYNMLDSNMELPEVQEARGSIFRQDSLGRWKCVCRALDKFGNWGESYAATKRIDWSREISIQEKVDGSIIKVWYDRGVWHISTNGTINAFKADCGDTTFGDLFCSIITPHMTLQEFFQRLNSNYVYWFEMVHPLNTIVVHYNEATIYLLGCRNMVNLDEHKSIHFTSMPWIKYPKLFQYTSLDECLAAAHDMGEDEEGYVVCAYNQMENNSFLRIKVKGDEYLKRHKLRGNGPLTTTKIISLWQTDSLDDFLAYFPENTTLVDSVIEKLRNLCEMADIAYDVVRYENSRKNFAINAARYIKPVRSYLFARLDNKVDRAQTYFKQMKAKNLAELIDVKEIGI